MSRRLALLDKAADELEHGNQPSTGRGRLGNASGPRRTSGSQSKASGWASPPSRATMIYASRAREAGASCAVRGASEVSGRTGRSLVPSNQASSANPVYAVTVGAGPFTPLWASNSCRAQGPSSPPFGPCRWPVPQFPPVWPSRPPLPGLPGVPKRPFMPALPAWFEYGSTSKIAFWLGCTKA